MGFRGQALEGLRAAMYALIYLVLVFGLPLGHQTPEPGAPGCLTCGDAHEPWPLQPQQDRWPTDEPSTAALLDLGGVGA